MDAEGRVTVETVFAQERRRYWLGVAALVVALPVAIAVHSWDSAKEWLSLNNRNPINVATGATQRYAGADWQLTNLARLPGKATGATVVLAEFEAVVDDPKLLVETPCAVALTDAEGRRWQPVFLAERVVREMHPEAADKPRCGGLAFERTGKRGKARMADTFMVPNTAKGLALTVDVAGARPDYLVFR